MARQVTPPSCSSDGGMPPSPQGRRLSVFSVGVRVGLVRQFGLLDVRDSFALCLIELDSRPQWINSRTSTLGLVHLRISALIGEDADDLADEEAAITTCMGLTAGVPAAK